MGKSLKLSCSSFHLEELLPETWLHLASMSTFLHGGWQVNGQSDLGCQDTRVVCKQTEEESGACNRSQLPLNPEEHSAGLQGSLGLL